MTRILFERTPRAYLPEIPAYKTYLAQHHPDVQCTESNPENPLNPMDFDIVWRFMGFDVSGKGNFIIHEYNSLSTNPFGPLKNQIKKTLNTKPDQRIFLNELVQDGFSFQDNIPYNLRDMGVDDAFFTVEKDPQYDFIYAGSLDRGPRLNALLERFKGPMGDFTLLLVGDPTPEMTGQYKEHKNIIFTGRLPYEDIPATMAKARYGLNIMPDLYPFNRQTATKVLEYCAVGLPIISNRYLWIENFSQERQGQFFWLTPDARNLTPEAIEHFNFHTPNVEDLKWDTIIRDSKVFDFLSEIPQKT